MKETLLLRVIAIPMILLAIIFYLQIQKQFDIKTDKQTILFSDQKIPINFEYPSEWKILGLTKTPSSREEHLSQDYVVSVGDEAFEVSLRSSKDNDITPPDKSKCQPYIPCEALFFQKSLDLEKYNANDFEETVTNIFLSTNGGWTMKFNNQNEPEYVKTASYHKNDWFYVLEKIGDKLTSEMSILGHTSPADYMTISYTFKTGDSTRSWSKYKEILSGIIKSLKIKR